MPRKLLILLAFATTFLTWGCGRSTGGSGDDVQGVAVAGSSYAGLVIAAVNVDPSIKTSRIYWYDFATGTAHELLPGESGNPAVFWADGKVFLFNRQPDQKTYRTFDPRQTVVPPTAPKDLTGVADGDPFDVAGLVAGKTVALASPVGGALQVLDEETGSITSVSAASLPAGTLRPHALMRAGSKLFALHSAAQAHDQPAMKPQVISLDVAADGTLSLADGTPLPQTVPVDAEALLAPGANTVAVPFSYPVAFNDQDGQGGATLVGLCDASWSACTEGTGRLKAGTSFDAEAESLTDLAYVDQSVVDGPSDTLVYAHVKAKDTYEVVKLDTQSKATTTVQSFGSEPRQVGLAYDRSSGMLFVGGPADEYKGSLTLYHDDQAAGSFELDGVPYSLALVPK